MGEVLHAWALAPAAVGACCMAADRGRARVPEVAASLVMLLAMADAAVLHALAPVIWAVVLVLTAIVGAAVRRGRATVMTLHGTAGLVVMAGLVVAMGANPAVGAHHGGAALGTVAAAVCVAYVLASAALAVSPSRRPGPEASHTSRLGRVQVGAMGASVAAMGVALLA